MRKIALALAILLPAVLLGGASPATAVATRGWTATWSTALTAATDFDVNNSKTGFNDQSIRMIIRTSASAGTQVRVRFSNTYGVHAVQVGHASVAVPASPGSADLVPGSVHELTFNGSTSITLYKGASVVSDPLSMQAPALSQLAVTVYFPTATNDTTWHWEAHQSTYVYSGDRALNASGSESTATFSSFYYLAGIDVATPLAGGSAVILGDSISDGNGSTLNANHRWPDFLANRISASPVIRTWGAVGWASSCLSRVDLD